MLLKVTFSKGNSLPGLACVTRRASLCFQSSMALQINDSVRPLSVVFAQLSPRPNLAVTQIF